MSIVKQLLTISAMSAAIMEVLDMTIVNVALYDIQGALSCTADQVSWVLTSYMVANGILMPLTGLLAHKLSIKTYFIICIIGFTIASAACGISQTVEQMIFARLLQGAFGAGLIPLSQSIMVNSYPPHERGKAVTIWGMGVMTAPIFGPTLGGLFIEYMSWHWIFFINIPLGLLSGLIAWKYMPETEKLPKKIDWLGMACIFVGVGGLQFTLDRGNLEDWFSSNLIRFSAVLAAIGIVGFLYHAKHNAKHPIFSLEIFKDRNFTASCIIMFFLGVSLFSSIVIQPLMLSALFNYTAFDIGLAMAPRGLATLITMFFLSKMINLYPVRYFVALGLILGLISCIIAAECYNLYMDAKWIILPFILHGIGMGLCFAPLTAYSLVTLHKKYLHEATGVFNLMRTVGGATGIALVMTYFTRQGQSVWNTLGGFINPYNPNVNSYLSKLNLHSSDPIAIQILGMELHRQSQMQAFVNSLYLIGLCYVVTLPMVLILDNNRLSNLAPVEEM